MITEGAFLPGVFWNKNMPIEVYKQVAWAFCPSSFYLKNNFLRGTLKMTYQPYATMASGNESITAKELQNLGYETRSDNGRVYFEGDLA